MNHPMPSQLRQGYLALFTGLLALLFALTYANSAFAINISPKSVQVAVGGTATVRVTETQGTVTVSSTAPSIATVTYASGRATITGVAPGTATVFISNKGDNKRVRVTVVGTAALTVSPTSVQIPVNGSGNVTVSNAAGTVTATSSNTGIATVTYAAGIATIRGVAAGSATVTIADSANSRQVAVTVLPPLAVSPNSVQVPVGGTATVSVTNASGTVTATSSNTSIATVTYASGTATIRGVAAGSATVTIADGFNSRTVAVTVVAGLTVSPTSVQVPVGGTATVSVTNASGTVTATSSNTAIATVTYASGTATIRGVAAGSATVTIADGAASRTVAVTVLAGLTVSPTSVQVPVGGTATVSVTNASGTVTATSSNTAIATVTYASGTATIRGVAVGSATITVADSVASRTVAATVIAAAAGNYSLLAWNNLGMHCIDGQDYSIFSILPPLNTLNAQLVNKTTGDLVNTGVTLTYQATADASGSINTISSTKTNFWQYAQSLFGLSPAPDVGLLGYPMASSTPAPMAYSSINNWFEAVGIPITPTDDTNRTNFYPMVQVVAKNTAGQVLATTRVVLPVSDELTCTACHSSTNSTNTAANAAKPAAGWVFDPDPLKDWKKNILLLHDEKQAGNAAYASALAAKGYTDGLYNSALAGKPTLCVACHVSNAYQIEAGFPTGITGISALTKALHANHASAVDPVSGSTLDNIDNRSSCYLCHPGSVTQCLRGAMADVKDASGNVAIGCQSCHGNMSKVGAATRSGWLSEPDCRACHHDSKRETSAVNAQGDLLTWADARFATTPNRPETGFDLYRFSTGHGNLQCSACHGSTHAEYPTTEPNDNEQSIALQGYGGTVHECTVCHASVPNTTSGGPHGMHTIGSAWVRDHHDLAKSATARASCAYCHGADFRGSFLSEVKTTKTFNAGDGRTVSFTAGQQVGCYNCHNGPTGGALPVKTLFAANDGNYFGLVVATTLDYLVALRDRIVAIVSG